MTDKKSRRVIIINNIQSGTIDQAIFILKSDKSDVLPAGADISIANEAQNIINNYIRQVEHHKSLIQKKSRHVPGWLKFLVATASIAAFIVFLAHII